MKRTQFLKNFLGLGLFTVWGCQTDSQKASLAAIGSVDKKKEEQDFVDKLRQELKTAWFRSETMTMANVEQMPPELFTYKYTDEAMSFSEQWRHCVKYTCGQLAKHTGLKNPYQDVKLPVQMPKEDVLKELKNMYTYVQESIDELPMEKLLAECEFAGDNIPVWRLFYAMENHIIHHRGQCIVYLRLKGVVPKGYYGW